MTTDTLIRSSTTLLYAEDLAEDLSLMIPNESTLKRVFHEDDRDVHIFANLTGDRNPIHLDDEAGRHSQFKCRIAHGMLASCNVMTIIGMQLAPGVILLKETTSFKAPVPVGSNLTAIVAVNEVTLTPNETHSKVEFTGWAWVVGQAKPAVLMTILALVPNRPK